MNAHSKYESFLAWFGRGALRLVWPCAVSHKLWMGEEHDPTRVLRNDYSSFDQASTRCALMPCR